MGAEKEIASAAALSGGVETLRAGLSNFESATGQMNSIFQDFEGRLGRLEGEMLPMKDISAKLTMARRNITLAINKVIMFHIIPSYFSVFRKAYCRRRTRWSCGATIVMALK